MKSSTVLLYVPFVCVIHLACVSPIIFISLCATHIVPLPLFCSHYFHSTACTTSHPLFPFLLPLLGDDGCFHFSFNNTPLLLSLPFYCHSDSIHDLNVQYQFSLFVLFFLWSYVYLYYLFVLTFPISFLCSH